MDKNKFIITTTQFNDTVYIQLGNVKTIEFIPNSENLCKIDGEIVFVTAETISKLRTIVTEGVI